MKEHVEADKKINDEKRKIVINGITLVAIKPFPTSSKQEEHTIKSSADEQSKTSTQKHKNEEAE